MIEINNLTATAISKEFLKRVVEKVLKGENRKKEYLSIAFVGEKKIRELNKKYRGEDRVTDVLSFGDVPYSIATLRGVSHFVRSSKFPNPIKGLGEIIVCSDVIKKNAERYHSTFKKELVRVLIHGVLHLLGYEHEKNEAEAERMKGREKYYLSQI